ncbi:helicase RepA family protein, partial [Aeromonas caviae]|uniref:helicase RepA family protein n=1 Tax=Aeromonas caviae TaxID=648 RepID=UPI001CC4A19F
GNDRRGFFVRFGVSKQNYDATPLDQWYERRDGGVLVPFGTSTSSTGTSTPPSRRSYHWSSGVAS